MTDREPLDPERMMTMIGTKRAKPDGLTPGESAMWDQLAAEMKDAADAGYVVSYGISAYEDEG